MADEDSPDVYLFVVDTDSYAGNFERQMCAYMTGQIGECTVGDIEAEIAKGEITSEVAQLEEIIAGFYDEHGCYRPVTIFPSPKHGDGGTGHNSVAIYFNEIPDSKLVEVLKSRAGGFAELHKNSELGEEIVIEGFRLLERKTNYRELDI